METNFNFSFNDEEITAKFKGIADRIDKISDTIRIIDYKTGVVEAGNLKISALDELIENSDRNKAFQVLFYSYLFYKNNLALVENNKIESGIISFRKLSNNFMAFHLKNDKTISASIFNEFEIILATILSEILDEKIPFTHTTEAKYCKFCTQ